MGLFCGKKCECKRKCKSWFSTNSELQKGCRKACKEQPNTIKSGTKEDYLCGEWGPMEADVITALGYDPCPGRGISISDISDPTGAKAENKQLQQNIIYAGIAAIIIAFSIFLIMRK
jgi:hypothetical protein